MKLTSYKDIPKFTRNAAYKVDIGWGYLEQWLDDALTEDPKLDLEPDFQRAHVWNEDQQVKYVEYVLRGGTSGLDLYFNCPGWGTTLMMAGPYVIVDGKQRLQAVRRFLTNEIKAFGSYRREYTDTIRLSGPSFRWWINNLKTRKELLQWYLDLNTGGTPHTNEEIEKVKALLVTENS